MGGRESSVQIHSLSPGLIKASGVCLIPGFVTVALRCSGPSGRCGGSSHGLHASAFGMVHPPGSTCVRSVGQSQSYNGIPGHWEKDFSLYSESPPAFPEEVRSLTVADLLKKRIFPLMGQPNRFQIFISPSVHTGSGQSEGETGGRGGRGDHGKSGRKDQNPGWGSPPGGAWKSRVRRRCNSREVL